MLTFHHLSSPFITFHHLSSPFIFPYLSYQQVVALSCTDMARRDACVKTFTCTGTSTVSLRIFAAFLKDRASPWNRPWHVWQNVNSKRSTKQKQIWKQTWPNSRRLNKAGQLHFGQKQPKHKRKKDTPSPSIAFCRSFLTPGKLPW